MVLGAKDCGIEENQLFSELEHVLGGDSAEHNLRRIQCLEQLNKKLKNKSLIDVKRTFEILTSMAISYGDSQPFSSFLHDSFILLIERDDEYFYDMLKNADKGRNLIVLLSNLVLDLDYKKKIDVIKILIGFLTSCSTLDQKGTKEVYENVLELGKQNLENEIVKISVPYLDSSLSKLPAIIYSLRLCSKFASTDLTPKMLDLFERALNGYFGNQRLVICTEVCNFIEKTHDPRALPLLLKFSVDPNSGNMGGRALAKVLKCNPSLVEYVLETLYDENNGNKISALISAIDESEIKIEPHKFFRALFRDGKEKYSLGWQIESILVRCGDQAKTLLFDLLKDERTYEFALGTLKKIGVRYEELNKIFPQSPMLQIYNFFYGKREKYPCDFNKMLKKPSKLNGEISGKPTNLDFFVINIFSSFNFVTMLVDSAGKKGVDIVCFNPGTLDVLVIGCTAGILKDDLKTMDALMDEMKREIPEIFKACTITPLIFSTGTPNFVPSDIKDANEVGVVLLRIEHLKNIVEMLWTGRSNKDLLKYLQKISNVQKTPKDNFYTHY